MLFVDLQITKLPIILLHPVLLALPLFTSRYPPSNVFFSGHSVSFSLLFYGTKRRTYFLNTYYSCTVNLSK